MADNLDLVLERTIDAPIDLVWKAYTDPEHLKKWFAPKPYEISEIEMDLKPGQESVLACLFMSESCQSHGRQVLGAHSTGAHLTNQVVAILARHPEIAY